MWRRFPRSRSPRVRPMRLRIPRLSRSETIPSKWNSKTLFRRGTNEILKLFVKGDRFLVRRSVNPGFCCDEVQHKADPESRAEEFMGRQARKAARSKEHSNNGANGRHGKPDRKGANHPLAVQRDFAPPDMPKRLAQRE